MPTRETRSRVRGATALAAGTAVLGLVLAGVATATVPTSTTGQIVACYRTSTGALRVIDVQKKQTCAAGERRLAWGPTYLWRGTYNSKVAYAPGSVVLANGSSYVARTAVPKGKPPATRAGTAYWGLLAAAGATGPVGPTGPAGPTGAQGIPGDATRHNHDDRYYTKGQVDANFARSGEVGVSGLAFTPSTSSDQRFVEFGNCVRNQTSVGDLTAALPLPAGTLLTGLRLLAYDANGAVDATVRLHRTSRTVYGVRAVVTTQGASTSLQTPRVDITPVIPVQPGEYYALSFTSGTTATNVYLCGVTVEYWLPPYAN